MAWLTRVGEKWHSTDDLTLEELAAIEKTSGVGWAYINPLRNIDTARALLAVWHVREGATDEVAHKAVGELTAKTLKVTFHYLDNDDLPQEWEDGLPVVDPKVRGATSTDGS